MARRIAQTDSRSHWRQRWAAACSTAPAKFYSLASTSTADGTPSYRGNSDGRPGHDYPQR